MTSYKINFNPFYVFLKKHLCPKCGNKMTVSYSNKVIPRNEVNPKDLVIGDVSFSGDQEIRELFFRCLKCNSRISINDMWNYEKNNRQRKRN